MQKYFRFHIAAMLLVCSSISLADHYKLFLEDGSQSSNYDYQVRNLQAGDSVEFSDGRRFSIQNIIGEGRNNKILDIGGNRILRIPLASGYQGKHTYTAYLEAFYDGALRLANADAPVVKVDFKNSLKGEYIISERLDIRWTFEEFAETYSRNINSPLYQQAEVELVKFARETAHLERVGDLHAGNLAYTDRGWVIIDFTDEVKLYKPSLTSGVTGNATVTRKHLFNTNEFLNRSVSMLPDSLSRRLTEAVGEYRSNLKHPLFNACAVFMNLLSK